MEIEKIMMGVLESKSRLSCASAELLKSYLYYSSIHFLAIFAASYFFFQQRLQALLGSSYHKV